MGKVVYLTKTAAKIHRGRTNQISSHDIITFLRTAQPGQSLAYFEGHLSMNLQNEAIRHKAYLAHALYVNRRVFLLQKKIPGKVNTYQYVLVKRSHPEDLEPLLPKLMKTVADQMVVRQHYLV